MSERKFKVGDMVMIQRMGFACAESRKHLSPGFMGTVVRLGPCEHAACCCRSCREGVPTVDVAFPHLENFIFCCSECVLKKIEGDPDAIAEPQETAIPA